MSTQTITLLIAILSLVCFFGTMYGIQILVKQGKDPGKQLQTADAIVDTVVTANTAMKTFIPAPVEGIIDLVLKVSQAGVHSAQQLYNSGQLPPDRRKEQATEYAVNMIKLTGREVTPDLEQTIRDTAEAAVYVMKQKEVVVVPVADPAQVVEPVIAPYPAPIPALVPAPDTTVTLPDDTPVHPSATPQTDGLQPAADPIVA